MPDVVVVSGTTTGVGKTWLTAALARALLRRSVPIHVRKPVQSFDPSDGPTDAEILAAAAGAPTEVVCPSSLSFPLPLAPPVAAQVLGRPVPRLGDVLAGLSPAGEGVVLVEGVGGPRSPLASDADTVRLAEVLHAGAVVIAAEPALGAISLVTMSGAGPRGSFSIVSTTPIASTSPTARGSPNISVRRSIPRLPRSPTASWTAWRRWRDSPRPASPRRGGAAR